MKNKKEDYKCSPAGKVMLNVYMLICTPILLILFFTLILSSCGVSVKVKDVPTEYKVKHEIIISPVILEAFEKICSDNYSTNEEVSECYENFINGYLSTNKDKGGK